MHFNINQWRQSVTEDRVKQAHILLRLEGLEEAVREFLRHTKAVTYRDSTNKRLFDNDEYFELELQFRKVQEARSGSQSIPIVGRR